MKVSSKLDEKLKGYGIGNEQIMHSVSTCTCIY